MSEQSIVPPVSKISKKKLFVIIGVVFVAIVVISLIILVNITSPNNSTPPPPTSTTRTQTLISSGTVYQLNAGYYEYLQISITSYATISGGFSVTGGSSTFYIFTPSEYANYGANGTPSGYLYTSGQVTSGGVNTNLNGGTYYFVFTSDNSFGSESISISSSFVATYS